MTDQDHNAAKWAAIDQLLAGFTRQLDGWIAAMQDQAAKHGPDQALANVMLALNLEPIPPDDMKALLVIALQRLATSGQPEDPQHPSPRGHQFTDGWAQGREYAARNLLDQVKQIEDGNGIWPGEAAVDVLIKWFGELGVGILGPGPLSCTECGHIDQPEYWHVTAEHAQRTPPDDEEEASGLEGDGEGYDTSSLAKEDARNAWQHTTPEPETDPEDGADYTIDKP